MSHASGVRVTPVAAAWQELPDAFFRRPPGPAAGARTLAATLATPRRRWRETPLPCFLLHHPEAGPVMVDCGPAPGTPRSDLGPAGALFRYEQRDGVVAQLAAAGVTPQDVAQVVVTHTHYDHLGGSSLFERARFVVHPDEAADAPSPLKGTWAKHRAVTGDRWTPTPFTSGPLGPWPASHDLLGDGTVVLVPTPGHTPGHVSVLLRLHDGRDAVLTGDAAYRREAVFTGEVPLLCPDVVRYRESLTKLRHWAEAHPGVVIVAGHDPLGWPVAVGELAGSDA